MNDSKQAVRGVFARAFTLIEMMVSVGILVIVIGAVGVLFRNASNAVGISQASMEMLSNIQSVQQQLQSDVSGMDKNGFLVIRCGTFTDSTGVTRRCDQMSFVSNGRFVHRAGASSASPFTDGTVASSAFVWWGQLAIEKTVAEGGIAAPTSAQIIAPAQYPASNEIYVIPRNQVPNGTVESDFALGRTTLILVPADAGMNNTVNPSGRALPAVVTDTSTPALFVAAIDHDITKTTKAKVITTETADITSSRIGAAGTSVNEIVDILKQNLPSADRTTDAHNRFEAYSYCNRFAALKSPYDSTVSLANGYFRMTPIALQGVSSLQIDWTDGSVYAAADVDVNSGVALTAASPLIGTTRWFGMYQSAAAATPVGLSKVGTYAQYFVDHANYGKAVASDGTGAGQANGDGYTAIFSYDTPHTGTANLWPVALRVHYHIADVNQRLPNGRDVVQIVNLPS